MLRMLHDVADRGVNARSLPAVGAMQRNAVHHDRAAVWLGECAYDSCEGGFAGAIRTHDGYGLAVVDGKRQVCECRCGCAGVGVGEMGDGDQWIVGALMVGRL